jgi:hypothetical protein
LNLLTGTLPLDSGRVVGETIKVGLLHKAESTKPGQRVVDVIRNTANLFR